MKKCRSHIIPFLLFVFLSLSVIAQPSNWSESPAPKRFKVTIPGNFTLSLPTADAYKIGYFIYNTTTSSFVNVGQANYVAGSKTIVLLGYDAAGVTGYKNGDSLITLVQNTANNDVYGIEFTYASNKNSFTLDDSTVVNGVFLNTWKNYMIGFPEFCQSSPPFVVPIPYGLRTLVLYTANCVVDSTTFYETILFSKMESGASATFQIFEEEVKFTRTLYGFIIKQFPLTELNKSYELCPGNIVTVPQLSESIKRVPSGNNPLYHLVAPGRYTYTATYEPSGCVTQDTISIVPYSGDCPAPAYSDRIDPNSGSGMVFPDVEKIKILNSALETVTEFNAPAIWNGLSSSGTPLPVGLYYIMHADGKKHEVSIIY